MEQNNELNSINNLSNNLKLIINKKNPHYKDHLKKVGKQNKFFIFNIEFSSYKISELDNCKLFNFNSVQNLNPIYISIIASGDKSETHIIDPNKLGSHDYMSHLWNEKILNKYNFEKSIYYGDNKTFHFINYLLRFTIKDNYKKSISFLDATNIEDYFNKKLYRKKGPTILIGDVKDNIYTKEHVAISKALQRINVEHIDTNIGDFRNFVNMEKTKHREISNLFLNQDFKKKENIKKIKNYANSNAIELNNILNWLQNAYSNIE